MRRHNGSIHAPSSAIRDSIVLANKANSKRNPLQRDEPFCQQKQKEIENY